MKLRFSIPIGFYVTGAEGSSLDLGVSFVHQGLTCGLSVVGGESINAPDLPEDERRFRHAERLEVSVSEDPAVDGLWSLIEQQAWQGVVDVLRPIANRCIQGIRNFGIVPSLRPLRANQREQPEAVLRAWRVDVERDGTWTRLLPEPELAGILGALLRSGSGSAEVFGQLRVAAWSRIEEAIQDDRYAPPELEFSTNAVEHLRLGNLRLSLLEAIIGLEIVITRYLTAYLDVEKSLSKARIGEFLSPEVGLTARLAAVLDLTMQSRSLDAAVVDQARTAVRWRNRIVHKTGHLPMEVPEGHVREVIASVLALTTTLAARTETIEARPLMENLATRVQQAYGTLPRAQVVYLGGHMVHVRFVKFAIDDQWIPRPEDIARIAELVQEVRGAQDHRFDRQQHLVMTFERFPEGVRATWKGGLLQRQES